MALHKLTARSVDALNNPGRYGDGGGLWLQVQKAKGGGVTKSWGFRYTQTMPDGRRRGVQMGLGALHTVSLADARAAALELRKMLQAGLDPKTEAAKAKAARREEMAKRVTFKGHAETYIEAHKAGWKNAKHGAQWTATLETHVYPVIGAMCVRDIETAHVLRVLKPIWERIPETASRVRQRMEAVLDSAKALGYRSGENPARWKGNLDALLPARAKVRKVRHQPAMAWADIPAFMVELRALDSVSARALEFCILTAARTSEVTGARWREIDMAAKVWTIPAERMKADKPHTVPLSARALEILKTMPRESGAGDDGFVFPGAREKCGLSIGAMLECLRGLRKGLTVHGFRSTFRDWAGECTGFPREVCEAALAHSIKDKAEAAYRRGNALAKRAKLMDAWAGYCETAPKAAGADVLPFARQA